MLRTKMKFYMLVLIILSYEGAASLPAKNRDTACQVSKALFAGDEAEAIRLLELGYSASTPDQYGRTPMHFAADQGFIKVMKLLIEKGYKDQIHSKTTFNNLPINYAVQKQYFDATDLLIKSGSDVNTYGMEKSYSPVMKAACLGNEELVKLLLDAGADMYSENTYLRTARWCAERYRHWKIVYLLDEYAAVQKQPEPKETCEFRLCRECSEED